MGLLKGEHEGREGGLVKKKKKKKKKKVNHCFIMSWLKDPLMRAETVCVCSSLSSGKTLLTRTPEEEVHTYLCIRKININKNIFTS